MRLRLGFEIGRPTFYDDESETPHIAEINFHLSFVLPLFKPGYQHIQHIYWVKRAWGLMPEVKPLKAEPDEAKHDKWLEPDEAKHDKWLEPDEAKHDKWLEPDYWVDLIPF